MAIIWDIETGANFERARALMPPFDESEVRTGNLKDEDKIKAKYADRRVAHERSWMEGSALRPETGHVLAIGILPTRKEDSPLFFHVHQTNEADVLQSFWEFLVSTQEATGQHFIGFAIFHFDLPFLVIRSRILGVQVPLNLRVGRYYNATRFVDLQEEWLAGRSRNDTRSSLDYVAKALGVGEKSGSGDKFESLYSADEARALAYLENDLNLAKGVARKLGLIR
jgi:RNase_H superfamily